VVSSEYIKRKKPDPTTSQASYKKCCESTSRRCRPYHKPILQGQRLSDAEEQPLTAPHLLTRSSKQNWLIQNHIIFIYRPIDASDGHLSRSRDHQKAPPVGLNRKLSFFYHQCIDTVGVNIHPESGSIQRNTHLSIFCHRPFRMYDVLCPVTAAGRNIPRQ